MYRRILTILALSSALAMPALAAPPSSGNFGIGVGGGTATSGLSIKYYLADSTALQGVVGVWGLDRHYGGYGEGIGLSFDYLFEMPAFATSEVVDLGWNIGPGLWLGTWTSGGQGSRDFGSSGGYFGAAGVLGLEFLFQPLPFDIVLEYRPALMVAPSVGLDLISFDGHIRFYF